MKKVESSCPALLVDSPAWEHKSQGRLSTEGSQRAPCASWAVFSPHIALSNSPGWHVVLAQTLLLPPRKCISREWQVYLGGRWWSQKQKLNRAREIWGWNTGLPSPGFFLVLVGNKHHDGGLGKQGAAKQGRGSQDAGNVAPTTIPALAGILPEFLETCECFCVEGQVEKGRGGFGS